MGNPLGFGQIWVSPSNSFLSNDFGAAPCKSGIWKHVDIYLFYDDSELNEIPSGIVCYPEIKISSTRIEAFVLDLQKWTKITLDLKILR